MIENTYALSILVRAVAHKNLSAASSHVGLSQPQLSRVIANLEDQLGFELLNRQVRRKASWTPQALKLAETFHNHQKRLESALKAMQSEGKTRELHIGTLEGLSPQAVMMAHKLFALKPIELISLDVYDRSELEAKFLAGDLDLILNTRIPSQAKPRLIHRVGYQTLDAVTAGSEFSVFSSFEFAQWRKKAPPHALVSNSLAVRRQWIEKFGGKGWLPSEITARPRKDADEVLLLGGEWVEAKIWNEAIASFAD